MDKELQSAFRHVGKAEWVLLILMAALVAVTAIVTPLLQREARMHGTLTADNYEEFIEIETDAAWVEGDTWRCSVTISPKGSYRIEDLEVSVTVVPFTRTEESGYEQLGETYTERIHTALGPGEEFLEESVRVIADGQTDVRLGIGALTIMGGSYQYVS